MGELQDAYDKGGAEVSSLEVFDFALAIGDRISEDGMDRVVMMSVNDDQIILAFDAERFLYLMQGQMDDIRELFIKAYGREPRGE